MKIRLAAVTDADSIWSILEPVFRAGETYALPRDITREDALAYWLIPTNEIYVAEAEENGLILGTYILRANQRGGGDHVANCAYISAQWAAGRGVGRSMCEHSLSRAIERGFRAIQFNFVVSTNERAIRLWESCGFEIVGRLPEAFLHPTAGFVDAYVMCRRL